MIRFTFESKDKILPLSKVFTHADLDIPGLIMAIITHQVLLYEFDKTHNDNNSSYNTPIQYTKQKVPHTGI